MDTSATRALAVAATITGALLAAGAAMPAEEVIPDDTLQFHRNRDFDGREHTVHPVTGERATKVVKVPRQMNGETSSIRWNVPPGVLVIVYEDTTGFGREFPVWGAGEATGLETWDFADKASAWAWYYVDGLRDAPTRVRDGFSPRPVGSREPEESAPSGAIQLYRNKGLRGKKWQQVDAITDAPEGTPQPIGGDLADQVSSIRWNLPPGVIAVFADDADGTGRRFVIWGNGEATALSAWKFNDRASSWAWHDITK
ncbi:MAG: hypothetical protein ACYTG1_01655 [Planctomycetota bacterium]|jgi:hypothetical protein